MQLPPLLHYNCPAWPGVVIVGRVPIHTWPRPLAWSFEWHDVQQELVLRRGEPWFYCRFETFDASRHLRLVEAALTPELKQYFAGLTGVVNYVNGTSSLFDIARQRRPERLLVKAHHRGPLSAGGHDAVRFDLLIDDLHIFQPARSLQKLNSVAGRSH